MTPTRCETDLLRRLAETPFADRLDLAAMSGWSKGAVYATLGKLTEMGVVSAIPHSSPLLPPTRRYYLTAGGLEWLAEIEGVAQHSLLAHRPLSARWQRGLLERLDSVSVIYRLAATVASAEFPVRFRWFRAEPADAGIFIPGGRTAVMVRQGNTADRTAFAKRLWRLRQGPQPGGLLLVSPDEVRLRQARRMLAGASFPVFLSLERDATLAQADSPVWHPPSVSAALDMRHVLAHLDRHGWLAEETPEPRPRVPEDIDPDLPEQDIPGRLLPTRLGAAEKRVLDLLSDWPWASRQELAGMMGVSGRRVSQLVAMLEAFRLVSHAVEGRMQRLALTDRGLAVLARRDRTSVGAARRRWSARSLDPAEPLAWRNLSGSRSRQLLRHVHHTSAVHRFLSSLGKQAEGGRLEVMQFDPPHRASRYFRHEGVLRSVRPDAFGVLRRGKKAQPFFLEWERRAVRPETMTARLAPYLRYYSSRRPLDDHGVMPLVLVVFDDERAATHFLRLALREMNRSAVAVPLRVSHREAVENLGPLGRVWLMPGTWQPCHAFPG